MKENKLKQPRPMKSTFQFPSDEATLPPRVALTLGKRGLRPRGSSKGFHERRPQESRPPLMPRLRHFIRRGSVLFILLNLIRSLIRLVMSHLVKPPAEEPALKPQSPAADPTEFDPLVPSVPVSYPIKTLESLSSRSFFSSFHFPFNRASVPLRQQSPNLPDRARVLVCHDMQGGYGDDRWVQGGTNGGAYSIWHWYLMDIFVYFSHDLVTVPPPCWTNTAHRHGVRVNSPFFFPFSVL